MATLTVNRCSCGRRMSKYAHRCVKCDREHSAALYAAAQAIVSTGVCPDCGSKLRRNNSMAGWWQCEQYGAVGFRADANRPSCNFQTFTE